MLAAPVDVRIRPAELESWRAERVGLDPPAPS